MVIVDPDITIANPYMGGAFQQATSGVTETSEHQILCNTNDNLKWSF
jgi:hypothetical protein